MDLPVSSFVSHLSLLDLVVACDGFLCIFHGGYLQSLIGAAV